MNSSILTGLKTKDLSFSYRQNSQWNIQNIHIELPQSSFYGIAGPNGSGKSTLLKLISGLLPLPYSGEIFWSGKNLKNLSRIQRAKQISYAPGYFNYYQALTVFDFVLQSRYAQHGFFERYQKSDFDEVEEWLQKLDLTALKNTSIEKISTGQLQLALIARALAQDAETIILDEALANLDFRFQAKVFEYLKELNKKGKQVFIVSHDLNLLSEFCPNMLLMAQGKIAAHGKSAEVLNQNNLDEIYKTKNILKVMNLDSEKPKVFWQKN